VQQFQSYILEQRNGGEITNGDDDGGGHSTTFTINCFRNDPRCKLYLAVTPHILGRILKDLETYERTIRKWREKMFEMFDVVQQPQPTTLRPFAAPTCGSLFEAHSVEQAHLKADLASGVGQRLKFLMHRRDGAAPSTSLMPAQTMSVVDANLQTPFSSFPSVDQLSDLLHQGFNLQVPEEEWEPLQHLLDQHMAWQEKGRVLLERLQSAQQQQTPRASMLPGIVPVTFEECKTLVDELDSLTFRMPGKHYAVLPYLRLADTCNTYFSRLTGWQVMPAAESDDASKHEAEIAGPESTVAHAFSELRSMARNIVDFDCPRDAFRRLLALHPALSSDVPTSATKKHGVVSTDNSDEVGGLADCESEVIGESDVSLREGVSERNMDVIQEYGCRKYEEIYRTDYNKLVVDVKELCAKNASLVESSCDENIVNVPDILLLQQKLVLLVSHQACECGLYLDTIRQEQRINFVSRCDWYLKAISILQKIDNSAMQIHGNVLPSNKMNEAKGTTHSNQDEIMICDDNEDGDIDGADACCHELQNGTNVQVGSAIPKVTDRTKKAPNTPAGILEEETNTQKGNPEKSIEVYSNHIRTSDECVNSVAGSGDKIGQFGVRRMELETYKMEMVPIEQKNGDGDTIYEMKKNEVDGRNGFGTKASHIRAARLGNSLKYPLSAVESILLEKRVLLQRAKWGNSRPSSSFPECIDPTPKLIAYVREAQRIKKKCDQLLREPHDILSLQAFLDEEIQPCPLICGAEQLVEDKIKSLQNWFAKCKALLEADSTERVDSDYFRTPSEVPSVNLTSKPDIVRARSLVHEAQKLHIVETSPLLARLVGLVKQTRRVTDDLSQLLFKEAAAFQYIQYLNTHKQDHAKGLVKHAFYSPLANSLGDGHAEGISSYQVSHIEAKMEILTLEWLKQIACQMHKLAGKLTNCATVPKRLGVLHCICRQPDIENLSTVPLQHMKSCSRCGVWFHPQCMGVGAQHRPCKIQTSYRLLEKSASTAARLSVVGKTDYTLAEIPGSQQKHELDFEWKPFECAECCKSLGKKYRYPNEQQIALDVSNSEYALHCVCRRMRQPGDFMIQCDVCNELYHPKCVNVSEQMGRLIPIFRCMSCCLLNMAKYPFQTHDVNVTWESDIPKVVYEDDYINRIKAILEGAPKLPYLDCDRLSEVCQDALDLGVQFPITYLNAFRQVASYLRRFSAACEIVSKEIESSNLVHTTRNELFNKAEGGIHVHSLEQNTALSAMKERAATLLWHLQGLSFRLKQRSIQKLQKQFWDIRIQEVFNPFPKSTLPGGKRLGKASIVQIALFLEDVVALDAESHVGSVELEKMKQWLKVADDWRNAFADAIENHDGVELIKLGANLETFDFEMPREEVRALQALLEKIGSSQCHCGRPFTGGFMLECEKCGTMFHPECEGIPQEHALRLSRYVCSSCFSVSLENSGTNKLDVLSEHAKQQIFSGKAAGVQPKQPKKRHTLTLE
jgi:hypothetical protein